MTEHWFATRPEAANFLGVSLPTLGRWIAAGHLRLVDTEVGELLPYGEVVQFKQERDDWNALLTGPQVGRLLGITACVVGNAARNGKLPRQYRGTLIRYRMEDVVDYWRSEMRGVCLRCGILGEAEPERGFMCIPCEHEHRTGRIYKFPIVPRYVSRPAVRRIFSPSKQV